jgi:DNA polymerase-3 subunit delta
MGRFSEDKVVWFKGVNFLVENRTGKSARVKDSLEQLTELIKNGLAPGQVLVISAEKVDKRKAFYKACKKFGELHEFSVPEKSYQADKAAGSRLSMILSDAGLQMDPAAKQLFLAKVGTDTRNLVNEVEKLAVYVGAPRRITTADVRDIVSSSRDAIAWDMADAFGKRDLPRALAVLKQLIFQKENAIGIIFGLEGRIRDLIVYNEALRRGWLVKKQGGYGGGSLVWGDVGPEFESVFSEYMDKDPRKIHPFRASLLAEQARRFSRKRLLYCLEHVTKAHAKLVSSSVPQEMVLELLLIRMLAVGKPKK